MADGREETPSRRGGEHRNYIVFPVFANGGSSFVDVDGEEDGRPGCNETLGISPCEKGSRGRRQVFASQKVHEGNKEEGKKKESDESG